MTPVQALASLTSLPEGPHFVYEAGPDLFLGRSGRGPLQVVWDTNILIDYLEFGAAMWDGEDIAFDDDDYRSELEALQIIINLWVWRDIRFHILQRSVTDAKKRLSMERRHARQKAVDEVAAALRLDMWADEPMESRSVPQAPQRERLFPVSDPLTSIPVGADRALVREALEMGAHVFMTRDEGVVREAEEMKGWGLLLASPLTLLEELAACGALVVLIKPETAYWPLPDLQRMVHLINAVGYA